jgi:hypothetical protein
LKEIVRGLDPIWLPIFWIFEIAVG